MMSVARGWESKSVEQQQDEAAASHEHKVRLSAAQQARQRQQQALQLSRQRVLQQLGLAQNPNHVKMLQQALSDLDAQLARLV